MSFTGLQAQGGRGVGGPRDRFGRIRRGGEDGIAVDIQGRTRSTTLIKNDVRETRRSMRRVGVQIGPETRDIRLIDSRIEGFAVAVADRRLR